MEGLEDLLDQLVEYQGNNSKATLASFFDYQLTQMYKSILLDFVGVKGNRYLGRLKFLEDRAEDNKLLGCFLKMNYYFDHCYLLNLDRRLDRLSHCGKLLNEVGIFNWSRFSAVDGKEGSSHYREWKEYSEAEISNYDKRIYGRKAIQSAGSWAILKSMYLMIKEAKKKGYRRILVLQDDLLLHKDFVSRFLKIQKSQNVPHNWKLLYLGASQHNWDLYDREEERGREKMYYLPQGLADGAFAVGIDSSVFDELLEEIIKFDHPVDTGALCTIQKRYPRQCFVIKPNIIIADIRDSDLRESRDIVEGGERFRWDYREYDLDWRE